MEFGMKDKQRMLTMNGLSVVESCTFRKVQEGTKELLNNHCKAPSSSKDDEGAFLL